MQKQCSLETLSLIYSGGNLFKYRPFCGGKRSVIFRNPTKWIPRWYLENGYCCLVPVLYLLNIHDHFKCNSTAADETASTNNLESSKSPSLSGEGQTCVTLKEQDLKRTAYKILVWNLMQRDRVEYGEWEKRTIYLGKYFIRMWSFLLAVVGCFAYPTSLKIETARFTKSRRTSARLNGVTSRERFLLFSGKFILYGNHTWTHNLNLDYLMPFFRAGRWHTILSTLKIDVLSESGGGLCAVLTIESIRVESIIHKTNRLSHWLSRMALWVSSNMKQGALCVV
jgi:hypothetical protein